MATASSARVVSMATSANMPTLQEPLGVRHLVADRERAVVRVDDRPDVDELPAAFAEDFESPLRVRGEREARGRGLHDPFQVVFGDLRFEPEPFEVDDGEERLRSGR